MITFSSSSPVWFFSPKKLDNSLDTYLSEVNYCDDTFTKELFQDRSKFDHLPLSHREFTRYRNHAKWTFCHISLGSEQFKFKSFHFEQERWKARCYDELIIRTFERASMVIALPPGVSISQVLDNILCCKLHEFVTIDEGSTSKTSPHGQSQGPGRQFYNPTPSKDFINGTGCANTSNGHACSPQSLPSRRSGPVYCPPPKASVSRRKTDRGDDSDIEMTPANGNQNHGPSTSEPMHPRTTGRERGRVDQDCCPTIIDSQQGEGINDCDVVPPSMPPRTDGDKILQAGLPTGDHTMNDRSIEIDEGASHRHAPPDDALPENSNSVIKRGAIQTALASLQSADPHPVASEEKKRSTKSNRNDSLKTTSTTIHAYLNKNAASRPPPDSTAAALDDGEVFVIQDHDENSPSSVETALCQSEQTGNFIQQCKEVIIGWPVSIVYHDVETFSKLAACYMIQFPSFMCYAVTALRVLSYAPWTDDMFHGHIRKLVLCAIGNGWTWTDQSAQVQQRRVSVSEVCAAIASYYNPIAFPPGQNTDLDTSIIEVCDDLYPEHVAYFFPQYKVHCHSCSAEGKISV